MKESLLLKVEGAGEYFNGSEGKLQLTAPS